MDTAEDRNLTVKEVAAKLRVTAVTLWRWRRDSIGPDYIMSNGKVLYPLSGVEGWLAARASKQPDPAAQS